MQEENPAFIPLVFSTDLHLCGLSVQIPTIAVHGDFWPRLSTSPSPLQTRTGSQPWYNLTPTMNLSYLNPGALLSSCTSSLVRSLDLQLFLTFFVLFHQHCGAGLLLTDCSWILVPICSWYGWSAFMSCVCVWIGSAEWNMIWFVGMYTQTCRRCYIVTLKWFDFMTIYFWRHGCTLLTDYILLMIYTFAPSLALYLEKYLQFLVTVWIKIVNWWIKTIQH